MYCTQTIELERLQSMSNPDECPDCGEFAVQETEDKISHFKSKVRERCGNCGWEGVERIRDENPLRDDDSIPF